MAGRSGPPGDQYVQHYPGAGQPGGHPAGPPPGYGGHQPPGPAGALLGPPVWHQPQPPQQPARRSPSQRHRRLIDYPRANRTGVLRWIPSWKLFGTIVVGTSALMIVALLAAYAATPIPVVQPNTQAQTTYVYYKDGKTILTKFEVQNRTIVPLSKMSKHILQAAVAAEDRSFETNRGVSLLGLVRAAWNNARGRSMQGGSTITQQYVKNALVGNERTWQRKAREFFLAIKLNQKDSKQTILANYLNTIYFGRNTYGIEAAAQSYFHKRAAALTLPQAVYLAGIINGPELYDLADEKEDPEVRGRAKLRYQHVLEGMVELKYIDQATADSLLPRFDTDVKVSPVKKPVRKNNDQTVYLEQMVKAELARQHRDFAEIARGGYRITTTFDKKLVDEAVASVQNKGIGMGPWQKWPKNTQVGLVSLDPRTGAVRAIYGGNGIRRYSAATQDAPQAGSTYKVFTLLAALEGPSKNGNDGISLRSRFSGRSPHFYDEKLVGTGSRKVTNFGGEQFGKIDLVTATEHSVNTVYAQLNEKLYEMGGSHGDGGARTKDAAVRAGVPEEAIGGEISNTLGNGNPHVVDLASAYGTIAAEGKRHEYYVIESIDSPDGNIYRHKAEGHKAFSKDVAADATYAMQRVVTRGTGTYVASHLEGRRPAAGKTGTVGGNGRDTMAAWFVGFTPQLSTAVVIHRLAPNGKDPAVVKGWGPFAGRDMQGGMFPVRIWTEFMNRALDGEEVMDFPEPAWGGEDFDPAPPEPTDSPSPFDVPFPGDGQDNGNGNGNGNGQDNGNGNGQNNGNGQDNGNGQNNGNGQDNGNGNGQNPTGTGGQGGGQDTGNGNGQNPTGTGGQGGGQDTGNGNGQNLTGTGGQNGNDQNGQGQPPGGVTQ